MDNREFVRQIHRSWNLLKDDLELGRTLICATSLPVDEAFQRVVLEPEASYAEVYKIGLSRSAYNILLNDYSYLQFSWRSNQSWRLAYYPNPWITGLESAQQILHHWESLEEAGTLTHEEVSDLSDEMAYMGAVPPIRFEYSLNQYREVAHPAAHFHVGQHGENRWACALLLGPEAFCMIIARYYYPEAWRPRSSFEVAGLTNCLDRRFADVVGTTSPVSEFTDIERRMLHVGRDLGAVEASREHEARHRQKRGRRRR